jgi:predicted translin family RNA/ssDNA-binding protein
VYDALELQQAPDFKKFSENLHKKVEGIHEINKRQGNVWQKTNLASNKG